MTTASPDMVNHPQHYTSHASGVECIDLTEHMPFSVGNAFKYVWRHTSKGRPLEDIDKAIFYTDREIKLARLVSDYPTAPPMVQRALERACAAEPSLLVREVLYSLGVVGLGRSWRIIGDLKDARSMLSILRDHLEADAQADV